MAQTKKTKKFEARHLKDTLERRKGLKKVKQKQQLSAKKKARRAEERGYDVQEDGKRSTKGVDGAAAAKEAFQEMSVDDFFQGGFEVPELPQQKGSKRKRESLGEENGDSGISSELDSGDDEEGYKQQLDALAEDDPEFHKYLQENEPELLDGVLDQAKSYVEDDEAPKKKKQRKNSSPADDSDEDAGGAGKNELTQATVRKWEESLKTQHSLRAAREVVLAFRAAAHVSEEDDQAFKYSISDPDVYHRLLTLALKQIPEVFGHHLPVQESKNGKVYVAQESKKAKTLAPLLRSQLASIMHLLEQLSDASTLKLTLTSTLPLLPYLLSYKKLVRNLAKVVSNVYSAPSATDATRIAAFLILRRLAVIGDPGIRENVFKATYQALVKGSRNTTVHTIEGINLMKNSASELWGMDSSVGYTTAFTFIRQLAIHLRTSIQNTGKESYKEVYNWQYVHSLDFWSRVVSTHCSAPDAPLRPLIYPLVQVTLGALRLIPTATYFPLRFQFIRSLLRISRTTGTYIPLAPALYEVLNSSEMRKAPKPSTLKPLEFSTSIRAAKSYLRTRTYQDGLGEQVQELFSEFFILWCKSIAFPELLLPVATMLKRWMKDVNNRAPGKGNKNQKVNGMIHLLVQKLEANGRWIEERRASVDFAPNNRKGVDNFLRDIDWEKTPLGAFVVGQRKTREEKARLVEQARRAEAKQKGRDAERSNDADEALDDDEGSEDPENDELLEIEDGEDGVIDGESGDDDDDEDVSE